MAHRSSRCTVCRSVSNSSMRPAAPTRVTNAALFGYSPGMGIQLEPRLARTATAGVGDDLRWHRTGTSSGNAFDAAWRTEPWVRVDETQTLVFRPSQWAAAIQSVARAASGRRIAYSDARRQPTAQFRACICSLQRSALVQSSKSRYPSGRPLRNQTTTAPSERGPITA